MNMQEILRQALTNLVRVGLVWLLGVIAAKYPTYAPYLNNWVGQQGGVIVIATSIAGTLAILIWSFYTRMRSRLFAKLALKAEPGTTLTNIDKQVSNAPVAAILTADPTKI
jgi:hypothetical protein